MKRSVLASFGMLALLCACNCTKDSKGNGGTDEPEQPSDLPVTAYVTTANKSKLFVKETFDFGKPASMSPYRVTYDKTRTYQSVDGFGFAVTTATCYNLLKMAKEDRTAFLEQMFGRKNDGIGSELIRVSIGASDFCLKDEYTWCDTKGLENFGPAAEDRTYLFPILKEIYAINPDVKIIASPWSCPKWMKGYVDDNKREVTFESWTSGRLKPSCYQTYADYFVKWIQAMEGEGFNVYAMTMQNEPLNHGNSMSLYMPWQDQRDFIKVLGPTFAKAGIKTKILLFDHNYNYDNNADQKGYPLHIYADSEASEYAAGSAWHSYGGNVSELDNIIGQYPDKEIYFTEASIGEWAADFGTCLMNDFKSIFIGTLKRNGKGCTLWNMMLDDKNGPHSAHNGACTTCFGGVTISSSDYRTITPNSHWYNIAHASAVILPGAKRIATDGFSLPDGFELLMFANPDGTVAAIICNDMSKEQQLVFTNSSASVKYTVPAKSLVSLRWAE